MTVLLCATIYLNYNKSCTWERPTILEYKFSWISISHIWLYMMAWSSDQNHFQYRFQFFDLAFIYFYICDIHILCYNLSEMDRLWVLCHFHIYRLTNVGQALSLEDQCMDQCNEVRCTWGTNWNVHQTLDNRPGIKPGSQLPPLRLSYSSRCYNKVITKLWIEV